MLPSKSFVPSPQSTASILQCKNGIDSSTSTPTTPLKRCKRVHTVAEEEKKEDHLPDYQDPFTVLCGKIVPPILTSRHALNGTERKGYAEKVATTVQHFVERQPRPSCSTMEDMLTKATELCNLDELGYIRKVLETERQWLLAAIGEEEREETKSSHHMSQ